MRRRFRSCRTSTSSLAAGLLIAGVVSASFAEAALQSAPPRSTLDGVYSDTQAKRGEDAYMGSCAQCHGENLISVDTETPSLTGPRFKAQWVGKTLAEKFKVIRTTMPATNPGTLDDKTSVDMITFILKFNGYPAGKEDLAVDPDTLSVRPPNPNPSNANGPCGSAAISIIFTFRNHLARSRAGRSPPSRSTSVVPSCGARRLATPPSSRCSIDNESDGIVNGLARRRIHNLH